MDLEKLPSVSEVYGDAGVGKTSFCLFLSKDTSSLWIERFERFSTNRAKSLGIDLDEVFLTKVHSSRALVRRFETGEISDFIKDHSIRLVVISKIGDFYTEEKEFLALQEALLPHLKLLYLKHRTKTVVITDTVSKIGKKHSVPITKSREWKYSLPAIFSIRRTEQTRCIRMEKPSGHKTTYFLNISLFSVSVTSDETDAEHSLVHSQKDPEEQST